MSPEHIKKKIQDAYVKAVENCFVQHQSQSNIHHLFRDVKLYGRDAGTDFVETHLDFIVQEAVRAAECKNTSLEMIVNGSGQAALESVMHALRKLTALKVDARGLTITLSWVEIKSNFI